MSSDSGSDSAGPLVSLGLARLTAIAFRGENLAGHAVRLLERLDADPDDAAALLDLGTIYILMQQPDVGLDYQARALAKQRVFRDGTASQREDGPRVLAFATPGDLFANQPIQFLLENSDIGLDLLYLVPGMELPESVPDHDLAMVVVCEAEKSRPLLEGMAALAEVWPRQPVLNDPRRVLELSRNAVSARMADADGICMPSTVLVDAETLARLAHGELAPSDLAPDAAFPLVVRPRDSQAGRGLAKLDDAEAVAAYLVEEPAREYYACRFVDYASPDGRFRKYRIAMIDGRPYICHMAISSRWMIHYLNADMRDDEEKRAEEGRAFATFDEDFAKRHAAAFAELAERIGLDYFGIDCGETPDGRLLLFEVDTCMIVHAMDSGEIYPYKPPQMQRVFRAFQDMLRARLAARDA